VSLLWPERLTLQLEPEGGLEELRRKVAAARGRVGVTVVLSNHFVRYAVLPADTGAATPDEELALARFQFAKIHGERAKTWEVRVCDGLACAIDSALLQDIKRMFKGKARLVSVQPRLMAAYNGARRRIPREGAWLLLAERGRTCVARLAAHGWASVYNGRETDADELLERERGRASGEALPATVLKL
jgi:hypothetical protein